LVVLFLHYDITFRILIGTRASIAHLRLEPVSFDCWLSCYCLMTSHFAF